MDKKGYILGSFDRSRVIIRISHRAQDKQKRGAGNRDFATTIEAVTLRGGFLKPLIIFKGKTAPIFNDPSIQ
jgi:hypothetical protein